MNKTRKCIIFAVSLVIVGLLIGLAGIYSAGFDFSKMTLARLTSNIHRVEEDFVNISVDTDISDVRLELSEGGTCEVLCLEEVNYIHRVSVENNTLTITVEDNRLWYEHIGIFSGFHSVTIRLPKKVYQDLAITCDTADVEIPKDFSFGWADITTDTGDIKWQGSMVNNLLLTVSTGDISVDDTGCQTLTAKTNTGDICLTTTVITQNLTAKTNTGNVRFDRCDAQAMSVNTDTGDVTGTLLSGMIFITETGTGKVFVPTDGYGEILSSSGQVLESGPLVERIGEITTDTGDIRIEVIE